MDPTAERLWDWPGAWPAVAGQMQHPYWYRMAVPEPPPAPLQAWWQISVLYITST